MVSIWHVLFVVFCLGCICIDVYITFIIFSFFQTEWLASNIISISTLQININVLNAYNHTRNLIQLFIFNLWCVFFSLSIRFDSFPSFPILSSLTSGCLMHSFIYYLLLCILGRLGRFQIDLVCTQLTEMQSRMRN